MTNIRANLLIGLGILTICLSTYLMYIDYQVINWWILIVGICFFSIGFILLDDN